MSTKHTPGPWRACASGQIVAGAMSRQIVRIWNTKNRERDAANAQLIAAAPDLLAALENLIAVYSEPDDRICCNGTHCGCMGATKYEQAEYLARAAIAKATGGEQ